MLILARAVFRAIGTNVEVDTLILIFVIFIIAALTFGLDLSGTRF
jgi:hypothetical protein